jgi:hypothetical protein
VLGGAASEPPHAPAKASSKVVEMNVDPSLVIMHLSNVSAPFARLYSFAVWLPISLIQDTADLDCEFDCQRLQRLAE